MPVFEYLRAYLKAEGLGGVILLGGGVIPHEDVETLKSWGVRAVFGPGTTAEDAIAMINETVTAQRGSAQSGSAWSGSTRSGSTPRGAAS